MVLSKWFSWLSLNFGGLKITEKGSQFWTECVEQISTGLQIAFSPRISIILSFQAGQGYLIAMMALIKCW